MAQKKPPDDSEIGPLVETVISPSAAPEPIPKICQEIVLGTDGKGYVVIRNRGNPYVLQIGSRELDNLIKNYLIKNKQRFKPPDIIEVNERLLAYAETLHERHKIWRRVAYAEGGIEIDLGTEDHERVRITSDGVEVISSGSDVLFYRPKILQPMAMPAEEGDLSLLDKYLNMVPTSILLFKAFLSYTLAHPKVSESNYVILVLQGGQGTGKTSLCNNIILRLIDPSTVGVQQLPNNEKELAIAVQNSHILCYDNIRTISTKLSDVLCKTSTGGVISTRQLYTDDGQHVLDLHGALVLNGIHSFIDQPDLAQRTLPITLKEIPRADRKSEKRLKEEFEKNLPKIPRGLFDLIASTFKHLPDAEVTHHERMIEFVEWLAAMERAEGIADVYQMQYSDALKQGQLDSLLENVLAAEIIEFVEKQGGREWSGTPSELLDELSSNVSRRTLYSKDWPENAISLSKRLQRLEPILLSQGIHVRFCRGKNRNITIYQEEDHNEV